MHCLLSHLATLHATRCNTFPQLLPDILRQPLWRDATLRA
jgi:hypothetical protein